MFNQLIEIKNDGNVFLQDHSIALMPKLWAVYKDKYMGSDMVRWIVAVEDYKSPYRSLPDAEREKKATFDIFGQTQYGKCKDPIVVNAREEYCVFQYDPLIAQYRTISEKIHQMNLILKNKQVNEENIDEFNDLIVKVQKSAQARDYIKQLIIKDQEGAKQIRGDKDANLSLIEQQIEMKENKK